MYLAHHTIEVAAELIYIRTVESREEDARRILLGKPAITQIIK